MSLAPESSDDQPSQAPTPQLSLTPQQVVAGYCAGAFPMARGRDDARIDWFSPDPRALMPLDERFHVSRSLRRRIRSGQFHMTRDQAFDQVIAGCAAPRPGEPETWINSEIAHVYSQLHRFGVAHSVEAWRTDESTGQPILAGGIYGIALGAAFFGESMFSRCTDASKVCLVHLVEHLRRRGYTLMDVQFVNPHIKQFGVFEIPRSEYLELLRDALEQDVQW